MKTKFYQYRLLKYERVVLAGFFTDGRIPYKLTIECWYLWGLIKKIKNIDHSLSLHENLDVWDKNINIWHGRSKS